MEWLKQLLQKATINEGVLDVEALMKEATTEFPKHAVPKTDFNAKVVELKAATDTIATLKTENKDNETLQQTIKDHAETIKTLSATHEKEINDIKIDAAITSVLASNKAKHADLLSGKFDREKIVVKDGKVSGIEEQVTGLKESYKDLFEVSVGGRTPSNPDGTRTVTTFDDLVKNADSMTAEEVAAQFAAMETK